MEPIDSEIEEIQPLSLNMQQTEPLTTAAEPLMVEEVQEQINEVNKEAKPEMQVIIEECHAKKKGGLMLMWFIIVNEAIEKIASYGLGPTLVLYLVTELHIKIATCFKILLIFGFATNFLPFLGSFVADWFLGRFLTIGIGSVSSLMGFVVLWLTATIRKLRPPPCNPALKPICKPLTKTQYGILISSFVLMAIGAGGIRSCSSAFGADQIDVRDDPRRGHSRILEIFFTWYYAAFVVALVVNTILIVYVQVHLGWNIGFGIQASIMLLSVVTYFLGSRFYIKQKPRKTLFKSYAQVLVVAYKNRTVSFPDDEDTGVCYYNEDSKLTKPTEKIRCLNKACIIRNLGDISPEGHILNPWRLCSVQQVEDLKSIIKVLPIWSACILMSLNQSQGPFSIIQAKSMDRHLTPGFKIPAGAFGVFTFAGSFLWILFYDRILLPVASRIRGKPVRINLKLRLGLGLFLSLLAIVVSATVEHFRKENAIKSGFLDKPGGVVEMSALWLIPQHGLNGIADAFITVAQNQFYYSELPKSVSSFATVLGLLATAFGNLIASFILHVADEKTKRTAGGSWVQDNINRGQYESFYWLLVVIGSFNLIYFLICCWGYGPVASEMKKEVNEGNDQELVVVV